MVGDPAHRLQVAGSTPAQCSGYPLNFVFKPMCRFPYIFAGFPSISFTCHSSSPGYPHGAEGLVPKPCPLFSNLAPENPASERLLGTNRLLLERVQNDPGGFDI